MRLTLTLLKKRNVIPGNRYLGKHQMPIIIRPWTVDNFRAKLDIEEKNMFYLRHPYITTEQEFGHTKVFGRKEQWMNEKKLLKAATKVCPSVKMENYLGHLNVSNSWER